MLIKHVSSTATRTAATVEELHQTAREHLDGDLASVECSPSFLFTFYILILEGCGEREVTLEHGSAVHNLFSSNWTPRSLLLSYECKRTVLVLHLEVRETSLAR